MGLKVAIHPPALTSIKTKQPHTSAGVRLFLLVILVPFSFQQN